MIEMSWLRMTEKDRGGLFRDKDKMDSWYTSSPLFLILSIGPCQLARDICMRVANIPGPDPEKGSLLEWAVEKLPPKRPKN